MIAFFRRSLASKLALGLLALVMLAFIVTGVFTHELPGASSLAGGAGGDTFAKVGDRTITVPEMEDRVRRAYAQYAQQQPGLDLQRFVATGGYDAVVDQTLAAAALEAFGHDVGLVASQRSVDGQIAGIRAFQDVNGKFNQTTFRSALAQQRIDERAFRRDVAGDAVRQMVYIPATGAVTLADGLIRPYAALLVERREGSIGFVPASAFAGGTAPTDAELQRFYQAHIAGYSIPERRVLRYATIGRDQVAAGAAPSEADIRKAYDGNPDKYAAHQTRTLSQVVLDSEAKAQAFAAQVKGGKPFAAVAQAAGFGPADTNLGKKTQAQFAEQSAAAVAAAAFGAAQGAITAPVKSDLGWHVVKVDAIEGTPAIPYATARPQIAGDLIKARQDAALAALVGKVQDALDAGTGFADVAKANGLSVQQTAPLTAQGLDPANPAFKAPPEILPLLKPGFASAPDQPATVETVQAGERYALLAVGQVLPSAPRPFAQVRDAVVAGFTADRAATRAKAVATAILAKVKAGTPIADAFKAAPVALPAPQSGAGRRLDLARAQANVPSSLKALFTMPAGTAKLVPADGGQGWYVVQLKTIVPADAKLLPPLVQATRGELVSSAADEYAAQLARAAGEVLTVSRNAKAVAALRARLLGQAPAQ